MIRFAWPLTNHGYRAEIGWDRDMDTFVLRVWRPLGKIWWLIYGRGLVRYDVRSVWELLDIASVYIAILSAHLSPVPSAQHRTFTERAATLAIPAFEVSNVR